MYLEGKASHLDFKRLFTMTSLFALFPLANGWGWAEKGEAGRVRINLQLVLMIFLTKYKWSERSGGSQAGALVKGESDGYFRYFLRFTSRVAGSGQQEGQTVDLGASDEPFRKLHQHSTPMRVDSVSRSK